VHRWENGAAGRAVPQDPHSPRAGQAPPGSLARRPARPRAHPANRPVADRPRPASTAPPVPRTAHTRSPGEGRHHDSRHRDDHGYHRNGNYHRPPTPRRRPLRRAFAHGPAAIISPGPEPVVPAQDPEGFSVIASMHALPNDGAMVPMRPRLQGPPPASGARASAGRRPRTVVSAAASSCGRRRWGRGRGGTVLGWRYRPEATWATSTPTFTASSGSTGVTSRVLRLSIRRILRQVQRCRRRRLKPAEGKAAALTSSTTR
jgi:hypothetical protein